MTSNFAIDTNILIYLHDSSAPEKRNITAELLANSPNIPSQVISEYLNTCRRLLKLEKTALLEQTAALFEGCSIISMTPEILKYAAELINRYQFQLFDAVIVAASIKGNCSVLYSEDMQHNMMVDKSIIIINPFI